MMSAQVLIAQCVAYLTLLGSISSSAKLSQPRFTAVAALAGDMLLIAGGIRPINLPSDCIDLYIASRPTIAGTFSITGSTSASTLLSTTSISTSTLAPTTPPGVFVPHYLLVLMIIIMLVLLCIVSGAVIWFWRHYSTRSITFARLE